MGSPEILPPIKVDAFTHKYQQKEAVYGAVARVSHTEKQRRTLNGISKCPLNILGKGSILDMNAPVD